MDGLADRAGWTFEPKWDGWRCLAIVDEETVDLRSRRAVDLAPWFPELTRPPVALDGRRAVLDGEIVVLRDGRPDFDAISGRLDRQAAGRVGRPSATGHLRRLRRAGAGRPSRWPTSPTPCAGRR